MNVVALALLSALTVLGAGPGKPPSADEQRLFEEGQKAMQAGDVPAAERSWTAGFAIARDPAFLVPLGEAQEKQGRPADAAASYRRYLQAAPDASDRTEIEGRLRRLEPPAPAQAAPSPGAAGQPDTAHAAPAAPAPSAPAAAPPAPAAAPLAAAAAPRAPQQADVGQEPTTEVQRSPLARRLLISGAVATGVTAALLVTAAAFGAAASAKASDVTRLIGFVDEKTGMPKEYAQVASQYEQAASDGRNDEKLAKAFLIGAAATAAVSATLLVFGYSMGPKTVEPAVALTPGGGTSAGVTWRF